MVVPSAEIPFDAPKPLRLPKLIREPVAALPRWGMAVAKKLTARNSVACESFLGGIPNAQAIIYLREESGIKQAQEGHYKGVFAAVDPR